MEKFGSFMYGAGAFIAGGLLIVGGWWIAMLNVAIDRYQGTDFTNFWTLFGLAMIFVGAYLPFMVMGMRQRSVRKRHELQATVDEHQARAAAIPGAASEVPPQGPANPASAQTPWEGEAR